MADTKHDDKHKSTDHKSHLAKAGKAEHGLLPTQQHVGPYDVLLDALPDIESGEDVWILLDPNGTPIGVQREVPDVGVSATPGHVGDLYNNTVPHLLTRTGAELSANMISRPEVRVATPEAPPEPLPEGRKSSHK